MRAVYIPEIDGYIRCHDLPGREPVRVFLHGLAVAAAPFYAHIAVRGPLAGRRSLLVDLLGHGYSDRPEQFGYTADDHAAAVIRLLDELGIQSCELVGHSMGGSVGIAIARSRPDLVARLVIAEANLNPVLGTFSGLILKYSAPDYVKQGAPGVDRAAA